MSDAPAYLQADEAFSPRVKAQHGREDGAEAAQQRQHRLTLGHIAHALSSFSMRTAHSQMSVEQYSGKVIKYGAATDAPATTP